MDLQSTYNNILTGGGQLLSNIGKGVSSAVGNVGNAVGNEIHQLPQQIGNIANTTERNVGNYFNPQSNGGQNFWSTPVAQGLGNMQQFAQNAPRFNFSQDLTKNIQNPIQKYGAQLALGIPESILNVPSDSLRAGSQLGLDFRTGNLNNPGTAIRDLTAAALPIATIATLGGGSVVKGIAENVGKDVGYQALWNAVKEGAITGAKYGGAFGVGQGLASSNDIPTQLINAVKQGTVGATLGTILGGATGGVSNRIGAIKNLLDKSPQVETQLRDAQGKYTVGETPIKPQGMSKAQWEFQITFNDKYKRNPYTPVYPTDLAKAVEYEVGKKGVGLSIRDVSKDVNPLGNNVAQPPVTDIAKVKPITKVTPVSLHDQYSEQMMKGVNMPKTPGENPPMTQKESSFANVTAPESPNVGKALSTSLKEKHVLYTPQTEQVGIKTADKYSSGNLTQKSTDVLNTLAKPKGTITRQEALNAQAVALKLQDKLGNIAVKDMTPAQRGILETSTNILSQLSEHYTAGGQLSQSAAVLKTQTSQRALLFGN